MNVNISKILEVIEKQGESQSALAKKIGFPQKTVNELLSGKTRKPNIEIIEKLQIALGIVSESQAAYAVIGIHQQTTPEENEVLQYFRQLDKTQQETVKQMMQGLVLIGRK
jgi:transcriptional regulator with XRE-family HTH domain